MSEQSHDNSSEYKLSTPNISHKTNLNTTSFKIGFFKSIKFRVWVAFLALMLLPLLSLGSYSFSIIGEISKNILIGSNIQAFQQVKHEIDQYVSEYENLTKYLSLDARLKISESVEVRQALQQLDQAYEYIERIILCDSNGKLIAHSKPDLRAINKLSVPEKLLADSTEDIFFSPEYFHIKRKISSSKNSNYIITTISFLKLRKSLEGIAFGTNFRYYLITQNGENVLLQPDFPAELIANLMERPCGAYDLLPRNDKLSSQIVISLPILKYGLRILVFQNASEVYAIASSIGKKTANFVLLICIITFILVSLLAHQITKPIIEIANSANELSKGNLETVVSVRSNDEIGFLGTSFNKMSKSIRNKIFELGALYKVVDIISSSPTYQQALDDCLKHLVKIFQAERGSIMMLSNDRTKLKTESIVQSSSFENATSLLENTNSHIELMVGEGIAGKVAETAEPIFCSDCKSDQRFKESDSRMSPETLISVPLIAHGNVIGVINLSDRSNSKPFTQEDLNLMIAIVGQMATSMETAKLQALSITDDLTGLYIRRFFEIRLEDEIKRSNRFDFPLTLVLLEVDNITGIMEKHGNKVRDAILFEIADILKKSLRSTDIPARFDSEKFTIILAHTTSEQALIFTERLREKVANHEVCIFNESISVTISLGIIEYHKEIAGHDQLMGLAKNALSESIANGKNKSTIVKHGEITI